MTPSVSSSPADFSHAEHLRRRMVPVVTLS
jgi:hypothetical protein